MSEEYKCEACHDTGFYGDNVPGIEGNSEYVVCDQCPAPAAKQESGELCPNCRRTVTPEDAKWLVDAIGSRHTGKFDDWVNGNMDKGWTWYGVIEAILHVWEAGRIPKADLTTLESAQDALSCRDDEVRQDAGEEIAAELAEIEKVMG